MHGFKGERVLMRIHIGERDKYRGHPLIMYRPHDPEEEGPDDWSVDVTGSWQVPQP
jgi:hypothetical protein